MHDFLSELEKTGIVSAMVESALLGRSAPAIENSFLELHASLMGESTSGEDLYAKMMRSFEVTLSELSKDRVLYNFLHSSRDELNGRLDGIEAALNALVSRASTRYDVSSEIANSTLLKISRGLQSSYKTVRVETNKGPRLVEISRIYIPPKLRYRETQRNAERVTIATRGLDQSQVARRVLPHTIQGSFWEEDHLEKIGYTDLRLQFRRVVVLGDPGGGKSTLCQSICYDLARQSVFSLQTDAARKTEPQLQKIPLRVILRTFERARTSEPQLSILEFILRDIQNHVSADRSEFEPAIRKLLATGRAVLAFDGLDEILATAQRRDFVDLVLSFCDQYPLCPVLVTSRLVGYDDAPLGDDFEELVLEKFDDQEVFAYTTKFMQVVGNRQKREAEALANAFVRQTTANAADLRRNPLMLGLMAWIFNARGDVPSNRPEIYQECATLLFERWDPDRNINADVPPDFDRIQLFSHLASKIYGHPELSSGVEKKWLQKQAEDYFEDIYFQKAKAYEASKALVKFIVGRAWVMSEVGDNVFSFTHQTFLEYFFARHIDNRCDTVKEVFADIEEKIRKSEWDVVAHLALQITTYRNARRQDEALRYLGSMLSSYNNVKELEAVLSFSARSLEYITGSETVIRELITQIVRLAVSACSQGSISIHQTLGECANCNVQRRDFARDVILKELVELFKSSDVQAAAVASIAQGVPLNAKLRFERQSRTFEYLPDEIKLGLRESLESYILDRVETSSLCAILAWHWYGKITRNTIKPYGLITYYS
ncbi:NACHT domain-containing protein [Microvirga soli]|uniref:NACHT domain-containing protein n=1 Tax=Microvirga soli TaxID=1854496 RepID=UPI00191DA29E|nr:NACHT domain-containing protein [Microvirga soli]